jgi:hypothetical protein
MLKHWLAATHASIIGNKMTSKKPTYVQFDGKYSREKCLLKARKKQNASNPKKENKSQIRKEIIYKNLN